MTRSPVDVRTSRPAWLCSLGPSTPTRTPGLPFVPHCFVPGASSRYLIYVTDPREPRWSFTVYCSRAPGLGGHRQARRAGWGKPLTSAPQAEPAPQRAPDLQAGLARLVAVGPQHVQLTHAPVHLRGPSPSGPPVEVLPSHLSAPRRQWLLYSPPPAPCPPLPLTIPSPSLQEKNRPSPPPRCFPGGLSCRRHWRVIRTLGPGRRASLAPPTPHPTHLSQQFQEVSPGVRPEDIHQRLDEVRALLIPIGHTAYTKGPRIGIRPGLLPSPSRVPKGRLVVEAEEGAVLGQCQQLDSQD